MHKIINFSLEKILSIKVSFQIISLLVKTMGCLQIQHSVQNHLIKTCLGFPPIFLARSMNSQKEGYSKCNQNNKIKTLLWIVKVVSFQCKIYNSSLNCWVVEFKAIIILGSTRPKQNLNIEFDISSIEFNLYINYKILKNKFFPD